MNPGLPLVLCFGLSPKQASAMRVLCVKFGIQYVSVRKEQYAETIGVLCGLDAPGGTPYTEDYALSEAMLVFCNLENEALHAFLGAARAAKFARPSLLAALTDTNRTWTPHTLQEQLSAERAAIKANAASLHEDRKTDEEGHTNA